jgi:hypothetical protein
MRIRCHFVTGMHNGKSKSPRVSKRYHIEDCALKVNRHNDLRVFWLNALLTESPLSIWPVGFNREHMPEDVYIFPLKSLKATQTSHAASDFEGLSSITSTMWSTPSPEGLPPTPRHPLLRPISKGTSPTYLQSS